MITESQILCILPVIIRNLQEFKQKFTLFLKKFIWQDSA